MTDILSPLPGTFYRKSSPEAEFFKSEGDSVAEGDVIGLIEVMKSFIEVKADTAGSFAGYLVEDSTPVTVGQPLAQVTS